MDKSSISFKPRIIISSLPSENCGSTQGTFLTERPFLFPVGRKIAWRASRYLLNGGERLRTLRRPKVCEFFVAPGFRPVPDRCYQPEITAQKGGPRRVTDSGVQRHVAGACNKAVSANLTSISRLCRLGLVQPGVNRATGQSYRIICLHRTAAGWL